MKKTGFSFLCIFFLALFLLSLPFEHNIALRNVLAEKLLFFSKLTSKNGEVPANSAADLWLKQQDDAETKAKEFAVALSPNDSFIVGKVVFRPKGTSNNALWIDVGSSDNPENGKKIIARNSPVLSGDSLVGVIDYVGKNASLVRLISDSGLKVSARVARHLPDISIIHALQVIEEQKELLTEDQQRALLFLLSRLKEELNIPKDPLYLAKGTLEGISHSSKLLLKGAGFTYDFKDNHGPSRDLRTGIAIDPLGEFDPREAAPLVQVGDLLVTSGMDGLFPEGLKIARVERILPLDEGAYAYELLAKPTAIDLFDLTYVTVAAPQEFDKSQIPTRVDKIIQQLDTAS
jgi:cell shape-determining protein MreC